MRKGSVAIAAVLTLGLGVGTAQASTPAVPVPKSTVKLYTAYSNLYAKASKPGVKVHAGRNVVKYGSPKNGKPNHALVRREFTRLYIAFNPSIRSSFWYLDRIYQRDGYWAAVEATWQADNVPSWKRNFLRCIPRYEGGRTYPDVIFGGQRASQIGIRALAAKGNVVLGPWQVRPGWVNGYIALGKRAGRVYYGSDSWSWETYITAIHPVHMARIVEGIGPSAYATMSRCL